MDGIRRSVHDKVVGGRDLADSPEQTAQQGRQMFSVRACARPLEHVVVLAIKDPNLVWDTRGIGTKRDVIALRIDDAFSLALFLLHDVAKNAALFFLEPFSRGTQFVEKSSRHE